MHPEGRAADVVMLGFDGFRVLDAREVGRELELVIETVADRDERGDCDDAEATVAITRKSIDAGLAHHTCGGPLPVRDFQEHPSPEVRLRAVGPVCGYSAARGRLATSRRSSGRRSVVQATVAVAQVPSVARPGSRL